MRMHGTAWHRKMHYLSQACRSPLKVAELWVDGVKSLMAAAI